MNIETLLLSRHQGQFNDLLRFMKSLIVKNQIEGEEAETADTLKAYELYEGAYIKQDSIVSYNYTVSDLVNFGFPRLKAEKYYADPREFQTMIMNGDYLGKAFIAHMRKLRVEEYQEANAYYKQFCGYPADEGQVIQIINNDKKDDSDPDTIPLHKVTLSKYPRTYSRLYYDRDINKIYKKFDYIYLRFLEEPMTPYDIRNADRFQICYYDKSILSNSELAYWFEVYDKARNEILTIDYMDSFENTYKNYASVMFMFILSYAFNMYCAKMLEKYAVRDFTDQEIYDILESHSLGNLRGLSMALLRRIVDNLPDLKCYTGTDKVIDLIFDIVADNTLTVKRLFLTKKYRTKSDEVADLDKEKLYDQNIDIVFEERTLRKGSDVKDSIDQELKYETVVMPDDTWGCTQDVDTDEQKLAIKQAMMKEIEQSDFATITTKYISLSKIVDITAKLISINNKLGLLYQYLEEHNDQIASDRVLFDGIDVNALAVFAAWCIVYSKMNGMSDPDKIPVERTLIEGIMKLRTTDKLETELLRTKNLVIDLGKGTFHETYTAENATGRDQKLETIVEMMKPGILERHPKFSHFSLNKISKDVAKFRIYPIYNTDKADGVLAYDGREFLEKIEVATFTDSAGKKRIVTTTVKYGFTGQSETEEVKDIKDEDGFNPEDDLTSGEVQVSSVPNPNYRHVFKYSDSVAEYIGLSGSSSVLAELRPTFYYNKNNTKDGTYAYDANTLSGYKVTTVSEDSNGKKKTSIATYKYNLETTSAVMVGNEVHEESGFNPDDINIITKSETTTEANLNKFKVYEMDGGEWIPSINAWGETNLYVDASGNLMLRDGDTYPFYAIFVYANTVGDYLTDEEIAKYMIKFKPSTTVYELFDQYEDNYAIIEAIKEKISNSFSYSEYMLWDTMYRANMTYYTINELFNGARNYSEYIMSVSEEFYEYLDVAITAAKTPEALKALSDKLFKCFASYIEEVSAHQAIIIMNDKDIAGGEDVHELEKLFNNFISILTQLYKADYHITYDNEDDNSLVLLFDAVRSKTRGKAYTILELVGRVVHDITKAKNFDELVLQEFTSSKTKVFYDDRGEGVGEGSNNLVLDDECIKFKYLDVYNSFLALEEYKLKDKITSFGEQQMSLTDECVGDKIR